MENKIPKKIHLIWLGGEKPKKFNFLLERIKEKNKNYDVIEWNDNNINFELINQRLFDETENLNPTFLDLNYCISMVVFIWITIFYR